MFLWWEYDGDVDVDVDVGRGSFGGGGWRGASFLIGVGWDGIESGVADDKGFGFNFDWSSFINDLWRSCSSIEIESEGIELEVGDDDDELTTAISASKERE